MPAFQSKKFRPSSYQNSLGALYRRNLNSHPFLLFGFPFIFTIVAGRYFFEPISPVSDNFSSCKTWTESRRLMNPLPSVLVARRSCFEKAILTPKSSQGHSYSHPPLRSDTNDMIGKCSR